MKGGDTSFVSVPLHIMNGPVVVAVVPSMPLKGRSLVVVSEEPCKATETKVLREHLEVFSACVTRSEDHPAPWENSIEQDQVSGALAGK